VPHRRLPASSRATTSLPMFTVDEAIATAIRQAYREGGNLSG